MDAEDDTHPGVRGEEHHAGGRADAAGGVGHVSRGVAGSPGTATATAARLMVEHHIRHLPVVADHKVVGRILARDLRVLEASA